MMPCPRHLSAVCWIISALLFASTTSVAESLDTIIEHPDLASTALHVGKLVDTFNPSVEVHQVVITTVEQVAGGPNTPRHVEEKEKLMEKLQRNVGNWDTGHPRHRLLTALHGFMRYHQRQKEELDRFKGLYVHVKKVQRAILEKHVQYSKKFSRVDHLLSENQDLCSRIVDNAIEFYGIESAELQQHVKEVEAAGGVGEKTSVAQALKHYVRDWTDGGVYQREGPFKCLLNTLEELFPERSDEAPIKALVPGAGLGRLAHDVAKLGGLEVTANEWSMYMNVAYRFIETHRKPNEASIHPFLGSWSHHAIEADHHRALPFPHVPVNASSVVLVEGDFITAFNDKKAYYDVVITYFFIDTARNLMSYFDTIKYVLKKGGVWINLGPLLYGTGPYVQLTLEEILDVTEAMNFEYLDTSEECGTLTFLDKKVRWMEATYNFDERALTKNAYKGQFWVARRN